MGNQSFFSIPRFSIPARRVKLLFPNHALIRGWWNSLKSTGKSIPVRGLLPSLKFCSFVSPFKKIDITYLSFGKGSDFNLILEYLYTVVYILQYIALSSINDEWANQTDPLDERRRNMTILPLSYLLGIFLYLYLRQEPYVRSCISNLLDAYSYRPRCTYLCKARLYTFCGF